MYTLLKPLQVRERLLKEQVQIFSGQDFAAIFNATPTQAKYFLETQSQTGLLTRLKQGMYALKTDLPSQEMIANRLYQPSYISFEYALAYWGILPEMPYVVTSATTKPTREFVVNDLAFEYYSVKTSAYSGYQLIDNFLIAEPEKALVDYLYFVALGKKTLNDRLYLATDSFDARKARGYAKLYGRKRLEKLLEAQLC